MLKTNFILAHGFGAMIDLPIPIHLYWIAGGASVLFSFIIISLLSDPQKNSTDYRTYNLLLNRTFTKIYETKLLFTILRFFSVFLLFLTIITGIFGTQFPQFNFATTFVWVIWWAGFIIFHIIIGSSWDLINPWKNIYDFLGIKNKPLFNYPEHFGTFPAFLLFLVFGWIELIHPNSANPDFIGYTVLVYSGIVLFGMYVFGRSTWLNNCEPFTVFFNFISNFSPTEIKQSPKQINLRLPSVGLIKFKPSFDKSLFILLILSVVSYDGLISTVFYYDLIGIDLYSNYNENYLIFINSLGLILTFLIFVGLFTFTMWIIKGVTKSKQTLKELITIFVSSLLPISIVYHLSHYTTYVFINGQRIIQLISDPFGFGWNLFGTSEFSLMQNINYNFLWNYQVSVIIIGHIFSVYVAHKIALSIFDNKSTVIKSQIPMVLLMISYTILGLWLLSVPSIG